MSEELFAVSTISPAPAAQSDYDSICAALMQTERGRWFLEEYAKRNRSADTRILLAAIQRIETVVCADRDERDKQAQQGFRTDLLEMAKAITRTRAEVAEIPADLGLRPETAEVDGEAEPPPRSRDVFAAAERIRDVTWAMRGHGFDPSTCEQLEELAASILSASALRDPTDRRASKLSDVLQYLEHRIETLLVGSRPDGEVAETVPEPHSHAALPARAAEAEPVIGLGSPATAPPELAAADFAADVETPPLDFHPALSAAHDDLEDDTEVPPRPARELDAAAVPDEPKPGTKAVESQAEKSISPRAQEVEAQTAELTSASEPAIADGMEPVSLSADQAPAGALTAAPDRSLDRVIAAGAPAADGALVPEPEPDLPAIDAEPEPAPTAAAIQEAQAQAAAPAPPPGQSAADEVEPTAAFADEAPTDALAAGAEPAVASSPLPGAQAVPGARAAPEAATGSEEPPTSAMNTKAPAADQEALLPAVDLTFAIPWLPGPSGLQPTAALRVVEAFLPDTHMLTAMPGTATAPAGGALQAAAASPETGAAAPAPARLTIVVDLDDASWAAFGLAEPDRPPPPRAAPRPKAIEDIPLCQIEVPKRAETAELPGASAPAATAPAQTATAPMPQPPQGDPMAALKAMSAEELIALFS